jgi:hypothetical protein
MGGKGLGRRAVLFLSSDERYVFIS